MKRVQFHNYTISNLILGSAQLGLTYGVSNRNGKPSEKEATKLIHHATTQGITAIDTARSYGNAEKLIGQVLAEHGTTCPLVVMTKFGLDPIAENDVELACSTAENSLRKSARMLGMQQIPICLFHMARNNTMEKIVASLPFIFRHLKMQGLIDIAGVSTYYPEEVPFLLNLPEIEILQVPFSLFDQRLLHLGLFQRMKEKGKSIVVRSVFLQGLYFLSHKELPPHLAAARKPLRLLHSLCAYEGITPAQAAISFVRDIPEVDFITIGALRTEQINQVVGWINGPPLSSKFRSCIESAFSEIDPYIITPGFWDSGNYQDFREHD